MRGATVLAVLLIVANGSAAMAQQQPASKQQAWKNAYDAAIKCFVVAGTATGERRDAGDAAKSAVYEAKARLSFDTASKLGALLGYSGTRINQDFDLVQVRELPKLVASVQYYREAAATCRAIGLL